MARYTKLIVAAVGLLVLFIGPEGFGLLDEGQSSKLADGLISIATLALVYFLPNKEDPNAIKDLKP